MAGIQRALKRDPGRIQIAEQSGIQWALKRAHWGRGEKNGPLKSSALARLQTDLKGLKYVIINEFSMIGQKMFGWINRRCKEATGRTIFPFGGISVILVGEIGQLPSIGDQVKYRTKPTINIALEGYCMYRKFATVAKRTNEQKVQRL